jgi:hypothetical protein
VYSSFNGYIIDVSTPKAPDAIAQLVHSIHILAKEDSVDNAREVTQQYRNALEKIRHDEGTLSNLKGAPK